MKLTSNFLLAAAFAFSANMALALTTDELIATYQSQGFTHISIKSGPTQIQIEAIKDGQKVEVIYDKATGATIKSEAHNIGTVGSADPGVRLREVDHDFAADGAAGGHKGKHGKDHVGAGEDDFDADLNDDANDDQGDDASDDNGDDHGGDFGDDNGGDDGGDDHGGDDGDDDHGGDDN